MDIPKEALETAKEWADSFRAQLMMALEDDDGGDSSRRTWGRLKSILATYKAGGTAEDAVIAIKKDVEVEEM